MKEQEILQIATEKLANLTGAEIRSLSLHGADHGSDVAIEIKLNDKKETFETEIKNELRGSGFPVSYIKHQRKGIHHLLVSQYIPMPLKQELKSRDINYLEAAGNCFIKTANMFIYINDQQVTETRMPTVGKLWKSSGLKFLFVILRNPELLNHPYRAIAEGAGIALGSIGGLLEELTKEGFLKSGNGKVVFIENRNRLIERWAEAYRANLRPKQMIGNFRFLDKGATKSWETIERKGFKWGGENAGALLTKFLQPEKFTIYTNENRIKLMQSLKLVPDPAGNVEVLEQFWSDEVSNIDYRETAPPLLVYADLITSFDSRNRETANRIKIQYLD